MHSGRARGESPPLLLELLPPEERGRCYTYYDKISWLLIIQTHGRMRLVILKSAQVYITGFPSCSAVKNPACQLRKVGLVLESGRYRRERQLIQ